MPTIFVDEGEDWLKQYQRWKGAKWHKRIPKKSILVIGLFGGFGMGAFVFGAKAVMAFFGGMAGGSLFGLG